MSTDETSGHSLLAQSAVGLAALGTAAIVGAAALFGIAVAVGGTEATEDNWVGLLVVWGLFAALTGTFVALVMAVVVRLRHEHWSLLWLPLAAFPTLLVLLTLGEALWWE